MITRKKAHKEQNLKVTYEFEQTEDGEARLEKIFEFLLSDEISTKENKDTHG